MVSTMVNYRGNDNITVAITAKIGLCSKWLSVVKSCILRNKSSRCFFPLVTLSFQAVFMKSYCAFLKFCFLCLHFPLAPINFFSFLFLCATVSVAALLLFQMHPGSRNAESVGTVCTERRASVSCAFVAPLLNLLLMGKLGDCTLPGWGALF